MAPAIKGTKAARRRLVRPSVETGSCSRYKAAIRARGNLFARGSDGYVALETMSTISRVLLAVVLVVVLGGTMFLLTWEIPAPTERIEHVVPDDTLPR
jgi:hypothetical protein